MHALATILGLLLAGDAPTFLKKPTAVREGTVTRIEFTADRDTDVVVHVEDAEGKVIRFFPNLGQFRVEVIGTNNNPITTFGRYGNEDVPGRGSRWRGRRTWPCPTGRRTSPTPSTAASCG
jgi:hypothetical protein